MATSLSASMILHLLADLVLGSPVTGGSNPIEVRNAAAAKGSRWTQGTGSGQVDTPYIRTRSGLGAAATDSYNVLAAGALETPGGATVDLDEIKAIEVYCSSGAIKVVGGAANPLGIFTGVGAGVKLAAGQTFAMDLGAVGTSVGANGTFEITETGGATTADYTLAFIGAS